MSKDMSESEFYEKADEFKKALPEMIRHDQDMKRLIDLAKQSPFAAANDDFLRRMEMEHQTEAAKTNLLKRILPAIEKRGL